MKDVPRISKPCSVCGNVMEYVTAQREICSSCRRKIEYERAAERRKMKKMADRVAPEKQNSDLPAAF
jgi:hypothetical protein